eukprot:a174400_653.p1 GENE.a174400_653~~a174400_653.p1  ORF type:complete len:311 (-),score=114.03 a174400_653:35-946(-)
MAAPESTEAPVDASGLEALDDEAATRAVKKIPLLRVRAGPRDGPEWVARLKEEYAALIAYVKMNKQNDNDWFTIQSNKEGTRWFGKCWYIHDLVKYELDLQFDVPVTYPQTSVPVALPELDGLTPKMYTGGVICLTEHFHPLWARNVPHFGIAHALALGLAPWLAAEIPYLVEAGRIQPKVADVASDDDDDDDDDENENENEEARRQRPVMEVSKCREIEDRDAKIACLTDVIEAMQMRHAMHMRARHGRHVFFFVLAAAVVFAIVMRRRCRARRAAAKAAADVEALPEYDEAYVAVPAPKSV